MKQFKLGRKKSNRTLLARNLAASLVVHERITTTQAKAKFIQGYVERLITRVKKADNVNGLRIALEMLGGQKPAHKVTEVLKKNYKDLGSGYTRIIKIGNRKGDNAKMVIIELTKKTDVPVTPKKSKVDEAKKDDVTIKNQDGKKNSKEAEVK